MEIVRFKPTQYKALARVLMAAYGNYSFEPENLRFRDKLISSAYVFGRWTAVTEGECVGFGEYSQTPEMNEPGTFLLSIAVHPDYQKQGVGASLYNRIVTEVQRHSPIRFRAVCRQDHCDSSEFLLHRSFVRGMSIIELKLDMEELDTDPNGSRQIIDHNIEIETMQSLEGDPNRNRKLYDLVTEIRADMPAPKTITAVSLDEFVAGFILSPSRLPDATFVAVDVNNGEYVGISDLFNGGNNGLVAGLTGVRGEYRKRGIARALKQLGFRYADARGISSITTFNAAENAAIAAMNKQLGFIEMYTWLHFTKQVSNG